MVTKVPPEWHQIPRLEGGHQWRQRGAGPRHTSGEPCKYLGPVRLAWINGVSDVQDLQVWTLPSEMDVASVHLMTPADADTHHIIGQASRLLQQEYDIAHATLQAEPDTHQECVEASW